MVSLDTMWQRRHSKQKPRSCEASVTDGEQLDRDHRLSTGDLPRPTRHSPTQFQMRTVLQVAFSSDCRRVNDHGQLKAAVQKVGMTPVLCMSRVTVGSKDILFVISKPDVHTSVNSDTHVVFDKAKIEDLSAQS